MIENEDGWMVHIKKLFTSLIKKPVPQIDMYPLYWTNQ